MNLKLAAVAFICFIVLDFIWIGWLARDFYVEQFRVIGRITDGKFEIVYWAGAVVYLLMTAALIVFVLPSISSEHSLVNVAMTGALFGLVVYGVYDMTNYATLKDFPLKLVVVDMAWGTTLCAIVTTFAKFIRDL